MAFGSIESWRRLTRPHRQLVSRGLISLRRIQEIPAGCRIKNGSFWALAAPSGTLAQPSQPATVCEFDQARLTEPCHAIWPGYGFRRQSSNTMPP